MLSHKNIGEQLGMFSNNSDDENNGPHTIHEDFVSFPTLPDPEQEHSKTLTKIFTKTLRKVTTNATNLVQNYSSPKSHSTSEAGHNENDGDSPVKIPILTTTIIPKDMEISSGESSNVDTAESGLRTSSTPPESQRVSPLIEGLHDGSSQYLSNSESVHKQHSSNMFNEESYKTKLPSVPLSQSVRPSQVSDDSTPRVTSDNKTLRLSTMKIPKLPAASVNSSTTSLVINVNALASTERDPNISNETNINKETSLSRKQPPNPNAVNTSRKEKQSALQNRISTIFNNLPNDIELSDDSASDLETINNASTSSSPSHTNRIFSNQNQLINNENSSKSSSIKLEIRRSAFKDSAEVSPTLSTFYAHKNKNSGNLIKRKPSSNISTVIFDNAKLILNNNITGAVVTSTSSIVGSKSKDKKKKKKPKKSSENPLKNGGIPRKYWMNDSFVSDCLNCFKPFTAFRRKHHCRFCGQIFCSDCTLFISYNQHREERKGNNKSEKKYFNDKLRVCKPCYSDVIVYLSDDSSSSSPNSEAEVDETLSDSDKPLGDDGLLQQHLSSRIRSSSINSRRDSFLSDSNVASNKGFLKKDSKSSLLELSPAHRNNRSNSVSSPISNDMNTFLRYPYSGTANNDNMKVHPKHAPQMAIPTTRKGEAVEIPIPKTSLAFGIHSYSLSTISSNSHMNSRSLTPTNDNNSKSWFKNYSHIRGPGTLSSPDLSKSNSLDNLSHMYNNFIGKKPHNKYRIHSSSEKELNSLKARSKRGELILNNDNESENEDEHEEDLESENEDEQVMSLYTSLNHINYNSNAPSTLPHITPVTNNSTVVPTLGEFPTMIANEKLFPRNFSKGVNGSSPFSKLFQHNTSTIKSDTPNNGNSNPTVSFFEDRPRSDSLRSHERAHASLLRMRSRRKSRSVRNVSVQNNSKLPTIETHNIMSSPSPVSTPVSPIHNSQTYPISTNSNLAKGLTDDTYSPTLNPTQSSIPATANSFDTNSSPITPKNTASHVERHLSEDLSDTISTDIDNTYNPHNYSPFPQSAYGDSFSNVSTEFKSKDLVYKEFFDSILIQCLDDCDIEENKDRWLKALNRVFSYIVSLRLTDTLDIKQYIKIKKILGGTIEETNIVDGLFITKDIDSKRMPTSIDNPKIALLMFPIEYLKQKEQFISLRIIHSQQSVYITNLVSRLISLEPDIIVVGDSVCGLAEKLLEEANITVISNTKPQVIERISRYTKADIFQSVNDLFFKKGSLGSCKKFEVKKYLYKNIIKTFSFFTGNDIESGFTISLRGGDEDTLNSVKYAAETLMPGVLNAKFEKSLFDNQYLSFIDDESNQKVAGITKKLQEINEDNSKDDNEVNNCEIVLDSNEVTNYVKLFNERKLSLSPAAKFSLPTALVNVIESYDKFYKYYKINTKIQLSESIKDIDLSWLDDLKIDIDIDKLPNKEQDLLKFLKFKSNLSLKSLINEYHSRARTWSNSMNISSYQLYPIFHKNIHLLHTTVSIKYTTPCVGPNIIVIDYYTDNDKCLGLFLDQIFQDSSKVCNECGDTLLNHYKTYAHGNGKLDIILEKYEDISDDFQGKNQRVMWSYCKECNNSTPVVAMSDETYYLSIGKFFELNFWGENIVMNLKECNHDFFKSYVRCFGLNDLVIRMEYSTIDNYEVVVPRKQLEFIPDIDIKLKIDSFNQIQSKTSKFFQSISKRLNRVKVDTFDKAEDGLQEIEELKDRLDDQINKIKTKTLDIYNSTLPTDYLSLNSISRDLQKLGVDWDNEFNEFEKNFLPSENEITRITQFHLRNFLMDKYTNEEQSKEVELIDMPKNEKEKKEDKNLEEREFTEENKGDELDNSTDSTNKSMDKPAEFPVASINKEKTKEIDKMVPTSLNQQSNIVDKINRMEQILENERTGGNMEDNKKLSKPRKTLSHKNSEVSLYPNQSQNKVSQLANFFNQMNFDQISLEFKKQREKELQKKLNKFKAIPIVESKPIVEIYNKIEDAVDVNDEERIVRKSMSPKLKKDDQLEIKSDESKEDLKHKKDENKEELKVNKNLDISQPEKQSLLKSLTNFWADRSATLWDPLDYPLDSTEHTFADSDVIVREDEPSSLVAFCLSSNDYKQKLNSMRENDNLEDDSIEINESNNKKINNFIKIEKKFKKNFNRNKNINELEKIMVKNKSNHLKYQFLDGTTNLSCKIFYSEQFEAFRKSCGNDDSFIQSLSRCIKWNSSGGKSGSNFLKTLDDRYIVKELSKSELESFVSIAPFYFKYISQSMFNTLTTAIAKIFGFYQIEIKDSISGKTFKMDFLIMENLFYNHKTTRIFDLKGSMRNRHVKQTGKENEVLLDENMIEYIYESPVLVNEHSKKLLRGSLFNDTSFLSAMDVMDYSLVIGIDDSSKKLYVGIIDWLRTFTWDKKVENWVKGSNLIGKKGKDPTIVTPKQYRIRFREAMERYILEVPDIWYEDKKSSPHNK